MTNKITNRHLYLIIEDILYRSKDARLVKNRKKLIWLVWEMTKHVNIQENRYITREDFLSAPSPETITRVTRKVIEKHPDWRDAESDIKAEEYKEKFINN